MAIGLRYFRSKRRFLSISDRCSWQNQPRARGRDPKFPGFRSDTTYDNKLQSDAEEPGDEAAQKKQFPNIVAAINTGHNVQWGDIKATFISDEEILVQYGKASSERKFNLAGFENRKNGKPIRSWAVLRESANKNGKIPYSFENRNKIEKIVQELNKKMTDLFPDISGKAIRLFKKEKAYKPAFFLDSR